MNEEIIKRWNNKVNPEDIVYHIGDFSFKVRSYTNPWEDRLNGTIIHIKGNHDKNNGVKTLITSCLMEFGGLVFYVKHIPPIEYQSGTLEEKIVNNCDFVLCGHVHNYWKWKKNWLNKICINVGCDVWGYEPIDINSILKLIARINKGLEND